VVSLLIVPLTAGDYVTAAQQFLQALKLAGQSGSLQSLPEPSAIEAYLAKRQESELFEEIVAEGAQENSNFQVFLGIEPTLPYALEFNRNLAVALDARVIFGIDPDHCQQSLAKIIVGQYAAEQILGFLTVSERPKSQLIDFINNFICMVGGWLGNVSPKTHEITWADDWKRRLLEPCEPKITPSMFRLQLMRKARLANKRIVLPEGTEPRTLQAANICAERGLAQCILLGDKQEILVAAQKIQLTLHEKITIIEPQLVREKYLVPLLELRRSKGLTESTARQQLEDNVVLGTMMIKLNEVDGLVSGAIHTTANTIRPALQLIKTVPGSQLVSSIFFMCLPDQVLIYGDCAINPKPTAEALADIAIQSANSAVTFGFSARIAMLSYSTGTSGFGEDVEKVRRATEIVRQKRPDILIEGPIQYDAAIDVGVAALKLPQSQVAGRANIFVFPDLNAGNIAYKMVQRSTGIVCIGPMLQGLQKPVNDLSRGCLVEDIVFTIALTAVQGSGV